MYSKIIVDKITEYCVKHSGLETYRAYLGMSSIGDCPSKIYDRYFNGTDLSVKNHWNCYRGYLLEKDLKKILLRTGILMPESDKEIIANFDKRFRGHIDGEDRIGNLIEIKSMSHDKFLRLVDTSGKVPMRHYMQIQAYLCHGDYPGCHYVAVSTQHFPQVYSVYLKRDDQIIEKVNDRAKLILSCIDNDTVPECECGRCKEKSPDLNPALAL